VKEGNEEGESIGRDKERINGPEKTKSAKNRDGG
jgi:hypothetical protein